MRSLSFVRVFSVLALMFTMLFTVSAGAMAQPANNGGPGNSGAASMCQKEGWMTLARSTQPDVPFVNQDECVSYGAEGGTLVPLIVGIYIPAGSTVTFIGELRGCNALAGSWSGDDGSSGDFGSFIETYGSDCGSELPFTQTATFDQDTLLTFTLTDNSCYVDYSSDSNHAAWFKTPTGYQVDIADAGTGCARESDTFAPAPGMGHLTVTITVNP